MGQVHKEKDPKIEEISTKEPKEAGNDTKLTRKETKNVKSLNKFLQNLLSDSDESSDTEDFLAKFRRNRQATLQKANVQKSDPP